MALLHGVTDPTAGIGSNSDYYVNTATLYGFGPKAAGVWPAGSYIGPGPTDASPVIKEMVDAYVAAGLEAAGACYVNIRPPAIDTDCTVLASYGGAANVYVPAHEYRVQVCVYRRSQADAVTDAETAFQALHAKPWALHLATHGEVSLFAVQPPFHLPPLDIQSGHLYRCVFNLRATVRG